MVILDKTRRKSGRKFFWWIHFSFPFSLGGEKCISPVSGVKFFFWSFLLWMWYTQHRVLSFASSFFLFGLVERRKNRKCVGCFFSTLRIFPWKMKIFERKCWHPCPPCRKGKIATKNCDSYKESSAQEPIFSSFFLWTIIINKPPLDCEVCVCVSCRDFSCCSKKPKPKSKFCEFFLL